MRSVAVAAGIVFSLLARDAAHACDRAPSLLEKPVVGAAVADDVIVGEVTLVHDDVVTVKIAAALKGGKAAGDSVQLRGVSTSDRRARCGGLHLETGKKYVLLLWSPVGSLTAHYPIDEYGGVHEHTAETEKRFRDAVAAKHPVSPWLGKGDVATRLVVSPTPANPGEIDLFVVLRNTGTKLTRFKYRDWPRGEQTKCVLDIANAKAERVAAKDVPIARKDITAYFAKHGRKYELPIAVGGAHLMALHRVTTAPPGWGYKEELGFVYYPIAKPGPYTVSAACVNVFGPATRVTTAPLALTL